MSRGANTALAVVTFFWKTDKKDIVSLLFCLHVQSVNGLEETVTLAEEGAIREETPIAHGRCRY